MTWVNAIIGNDDYADLDGVKWFEAPPPWFWHRHAPQSRGQVGLGLMERCACGAVRYDNDGVWFFGSIHESLHRRAKWLMWRADV